MYEKLHYNRQSDHVEKIFNAILCDFRKVHRMQHALFKLLQSWQQELDEKGDGGNSFNGSVQRI